MFSLKDLPTLFAWFFSTQATITGYIVLIKPYFEKVIPPRRQTDIIAYFKSYFETITPSNLTLIIESLTDNGMWNKLHAAAKVYLSTKINRDAAKLRISRERGEKNIKFYLSNGDVVTDVYEGIQLKWRCVNSERSIKKEDFFELSFEKKHRDLVLSSYIPYVERKAKMINDESRNLKMHSYCIKSEVWRSVNLQHPSTFDTMAMNEELKRSVIADLGRFIKRKEFYKRVGKAWKRGYLMYGPPGTGKTSLVAAMANYLRFDIYDLQLASIKTDADLRELLLDTKNSSILVIEDIDCSVDLPTRLHPKSHDDPEGSETLTLSGLLNCIDGLWSTCGDERIIIFTTNYKERLDPALLRPGRMDMHIYMGHCCFDGFKTLASNYLCLSEDDQHPLYSEIKRLISGEVLTPAQVAEELMKYEDADEALEALVKVLKRKRSRLPEKCDGELKEKMEKPEDREEIKM